jgi:hypothetical protein
MGWAGDRNLGPLLERAFRLLLGSYAEDVPQLTIHLVDHAGGGRGQSVQKSKGWTWRPFIVDGNSDVPGPSSGFGEVDGGGSLHHDVEPPATWHRSIERRSVLVGPSDRLVVGWGGAPSLAWGLWSTP